LINELNIKSFLDSFREKLQKYSNPDDTDKVTKVEQELDDVKDIMTMNIEKAMKNLFSDWDPFAK
jgi:hypothetical protein